MAGPPLAPGVPPPMAVSLFASHPLMLERLRIQLNRPEFDLHAYLLPAPARSRELQLVAGSIGVFDGHDASLIREILPRLGDGRPRALVVADGFDRETAFELLFLGVRGLVRYDRMANELVRAVQALTTGAYWTPRLLMAQFLDHLLERIPHPERLNPALQLSPREREVLDGILARLSNKEIAARLGVAERTAKFHVSSLLHKFGVPSRYDIQLRLMRPETDRL
jgi:DNA-binding NarL/FixJ family response regulator